ncbi:FecR domain-containing protein [Porticoccaceae bacterium]|nr:FecR domain-containing protein [Porticoccaceae bacterium]
MSLEPNKDNVSAFDEPKSVQAQASAWLAKLDNDKPSSQDLQAFKRWVNTDEAHIAAFKKVAAAWDELNILTRLPSLLEQKALQCKEQSQKDNTDQRAAPKLGLGLHSFRHIAVAATIVMGLMLGLQQYFSPPQQATYWTAVGEQKTITLPDNSVVQLNTNSRIQFDYQGEVRAVYLHQGEAHFSVAKNPDRPFEVYAGIGLVRAIGTAFSVALNDNSDEINVVVTEGVVEIAPEIATEITSGIAPEIDSTAIGLHADKAGDVPSGAQVLAEKPANKHQRVSAGSAAVFDSDKVRTIEKIEEAEMLQLLAWQQGLLIFSGEPLEEVVAEISRYTDTKIIIKSEEARALRIGGQFNVADTRAIFSALEKGFGLKADYATNNLVYLFYDKNKISTIQ